MYDTLNTSYTLETSVYQLVTHKKCKMAVKAHTLFYKKVNGEGANICVQIVHPFYKGFKSEKVAFRRFAGQQ